MVFINIVDTLNVLVSHVPVARARVSILGTVQKLIAEIVLVPLAAIRVLNWLRGALTTVASTDIAISIDYVFVQIISLQKDRLIVARRGALLGIQNCRLRDYLKGLKSTKC